MSERSDEPCAPERVESVRRKESRKGRPLVSPALGDICSVSEGYVCLRIRSAQLVTLVVNINHHGILIEEDGICIL